MIQNLTVHKAKQGDMLARAQLYEQHSKHMYNLCLKLVSNAHDAEDILQESFIQAFEKIAQLKGDDQFGGWLKRIVANKCFAWLNKSKKGLKLINYEHELEVAEETVEESYNYSPQQINEGIAQLPNGCKQIFVLFLLENFSHKEIANSLNISESTSKTQYQYAKKLLRNYLTGIKQHNYEF